MVPDRSTAVAGLRGMPALNEQDFDAISKVAYRKYGLRLNKSKQSSVNSKISKRLRLLRNMLK